MQPPLAARIDQPIDRQRLQHMPPAGALPRIRQAFAPKLIQLQLIPQSATDPARAPLPRTPQLKLAQAHLHAVILGVGRHVSIRRIKRQLVGLPAHRVKHIGDFRPSRLLAVVDLAQIKQMPLHPTPRRAHLLGDAPITMILAVLEPMMTLQKWLGHITIATLPNPRGSWKGVGLHQTTLRPPRAWLSTVYAPELVKNSRFSGPVAKVGLAAFDKFIVSCNFKLGFWILAS